MLRATQPNHFQNYRFQRKFVARRWRRALQTTWAWVTRTTAIMDASRNTRRGRSRFEAVAGAQGARSSTQASSLTVKMSQHQIPDMNSLWVRDCVKNNESYRLVLHVNDLYLYISYHIYFFPIYIYIYKYKMYKNKYFRIRFFIVLAFVALVGASAVKLLPAGAPADAPIGGIHVRSPWRWNDWNVLWQSHRETVAKPLTNVLENRCTQSRFLVLDCVDVCIVSCSPDATLVFFTPSKYVVGFLFFWPWPCSSSLLDFLFLYGWSRKGGSLRTTLNIREKEVRPKNRFCPKRLKFIIFLSYNIIFY